MTRTEVIVVELVTPSAVDGEGGDGKPGSDGGGAGASKGWRRAEAGGESEAPVESVDDQRMASAEGWEAGREVDDLPEDGSGSKVVRCKARKVGGNGEGSVEM